MNIALYSFANQVTFLFKEHLLSSLTAQQKKIIVIATVALSFLALLYYAMRRCYFSAKPIETPAVPAEEVAEDGASGHSEKSGVETAKRETVETPQPPKPVPPFIWNANSQEPVDIPKGYEWLMRDTQWDTQNDKTKKFLHDEPDLSVVAAVAKSAYVRGHPLFGPLLLISALIVHASLEQTKVIAEAVADNREKLRAIFRILFLQIERDAATSDIWQQKVQITLKTLSQEQLMNILAIRPNQYGYTDEEDEINAIPLEQFLKRHHDLNLPQEFVDGCHQLVEYAKYVKAEAAKEPKRAD